MTASANDPVRQCRDDRGTEEGDVNGFVGQLRIDVGVCKAIRGVQG